MIFINKSKGFTLIELLLVFSIIGLLSSMVLASLNSARDKARIAKGQQFSSSLKHTTGDELVGEWLFNECSGTVANDSSGFNNTGTLTNFPVAGWPTDSPYNTGCSLLFDGVNDYVDVGNGSSLYPDKITVEAWAKLDTVGGRKVIASSDDGVNRNWALYFNPSNDDAGILRFFVFYSGTYKIKDYTIPGLRSDKWYHLAGTADGTEIRIFVDGVDVGSPSLYTGIITKDPVSVKIGKGSYPEYIDGQIDNVRIYSKALNSAQIQKHYEECLKDHQTLASK